MPFALIFLIAAEADARDWLAKAKGKPFVYAARGRRDPFLFRTKSREPRVADVVDDSLLPIAVVRQELADDSKRAGQLTVTPRQVEAIARRALAELEAGNFERARSYAEQAQRKVGEDHPPELKQLIERIHRASELLTQRREAEEEFRKLPLTVDAIFWNPVEPVAMISGRTRREGEVLDNDLQIYRIEKSGVVFLYKNFLKIRKRLSWASGSGRR